MKKRYAVFVSLTDDYFIFANDDSFVMNKFYLVLVLLAAVAVLAAPAAAEVTLGGSVGGSTATISVTSSPSGAEVYDAGTYQGTTPCNIIVHTTATPIDHDIVVSKNGYYDYHHYIGDVYTDQYITVNAVLTPVVLTGYLDISSSPSGANVYVDGIYKGTSPLVASVDAGSHSIRMEKPGYDTWYGTYRVSSGDTAQVYASLGPSVTYGYINVHSTPSGANVYVDGTYRDNTPEVISVTAGTSHEVQVVYSGYEVYQQTVTVSTGSTVYLDANLVTSSDAYLKIASSPSGAAVYVDGNYCGNTGYSSGSSMNYMSIGPLTAGTHAVMLKLDGYNTYTSTVTLSPNEIRTMSVTLTQSAPTPSGNAGLHMASTPSGAEVYVDNAFRGYTPVYLSDISKGRHTVLLKHTGYNDWTEYVVFTAGQTVEKDVTMSPASVPPAPTQSPFPVLAFAGLAAAAVFAVRRMY
ncbi:MAG: PEGA domain-containing protein [Methanocorpusculum sp.]|nr:PEGA domain-containing protein [Methanocorpusculum sp.]